jgi:hypothetical protein
VCVAVLVILQVALFFGAPRADALVSPRTAAQILRLAPDLVKSYKLHRAWQYGLEFYLRREIPVWDPSEAPPAFLVTPRAGLDDLRRRGKRVVVIERSSRQAIVVAFRSEQVTEPEPR